MSKDQTRSPNKPVEAPPTVEGESPPEGRPGASAQRLHDKLRKDCLRRNRKLFWDSRRRSHPDRGSCQRGLPSSWPALDGRLLLRRRPNLLGLGSSEPSWVDRELAARGMGRTEDSQGAESPSRLLGRSARRQGGPSRQYRSLGNRPWWGTAALLGDRLVRRPGGPVWS